MYQETFLLTPLKKLFLVFVYTIFIAFSAGFGLLRVIPYFKDLYWIDSLTIIITAVSALTWLLVFLNTKKLIYKFSNYLLFWVFLIFIFALSLYSKSIYSQGILETIKVASYYFSILFTIFVYFQFPSPCRSFSVVKKALINVSIIDSIIALLSFILIKNFGINILNLSYSIRDGSPRFTIGTCIVLVSIFVSIVYSFKTKNLSLKDFINILLGFVHLIFIGKTRSLILYFALALIFALAIFSNYKIKIFIATIIVCLFLSYCFNFNEFSNFFINYFLDDAGISIRFDAISFFMGNFNSSPIFGMGFISSKGDYSYLMSGVNGNYYYDDVGLVGLLAQFGICGFLWAIIILIKSFLVSHKSGTTPALVLKIFVFYLFVSSINLSFMDPERLAYLFILFVFDDFCLVTYKKSATFLFAISNRNKDKVIKFRLN